MSRLRSSTKKQKPKKSKDEQEASKDAQTYFCELLRALLVWILSDLRTGFSGSWVAGVGLVRLDD
jgi:hypothetical protein